MADLIDLLPLYQETAGSVRARMDADLNAGLEITDPRWIDTREGSWYYDITQPFVLEAARLWDAIGSEFVAAAFPVYAWGPYLEAHAAVFNIVRQAAVQASGEVLFTGTPGTFVGTGTVVSAYPTEEEGEAISFQTTESGNVSAQLPAPAAPTAAPVNGGGTLVAGTYYYRVTALSAYGETIASASVEAVLGGTGRIALDWADVAGAVGYRVYRATAAAGPFLRIEEVVASAFTDTGEATLPYEPPTANLSAGVRLEVQALDAGSIGNVAVGGITVLESPNAGIVAVRNEDATGGGADVESDERLRERILARYEGQGAGNIADYRRWALDKEGVGRVTVIPVAFGPGTVQVVIMEDDGDALAAPVIDELQDELDPVPGLGKGTAPIGHAVTVQTPANVSIDITGTVFFEEGYSLDGGAGTIALRTRIEQALSDYLDALDVGEDVIYEHVKAQFFTVRGVYNIANVTVEGGTANIAISSNPPQIAQFAPPAVLTTGA